MLIYSDVNIKIQTTYIVHNYKKNIGYQDLFINTSEHFILYKVADDKFVEFYEKKYI